VAFIDMLEVSHLLVGLTNADLSGGHLLWPDRSSVMAGAVEKAQLPIAISILQYL
jgi:hypothetical protein